MKNIPAICLLGIYPGDFLTQHMGDIWEQSRGIYCNLIFGGGEDFTRLFVCVVKCTILTIFKCPVQWHQDHSHCCAAITTIHLQNFFIISN